MTKNKKEIQRGADFILKHSSYGYLPDQNIGRIIRFHNEQKAVEIRECGQRVHRKIEKILKTQHPDLWPNYDPQKLLPEKTKSLTHM